MRQRTITFCLRLSALSFAFGMFFLFGTHACGQTARWVKLPEVRRQIGSGLVAEIVARLPDTSNMRGEDSVGQGHYGGHGLNSHVRNTYGRGTNTDNASYMPRGWAFVAPEPTRFTLREVIARTSTPYPSSSVTVRYWNRQPLCAIDEYSAYANGTIAGIEAGQAQSNRTRDSFRFASALLDHVRTVGILARETGYPHTAELAGYVQYVEKLHGQIAARMGGR